MLLPPPEVVFLVVVAVPLEEVEPVLLVVFLVVVLGLPSLSRLITLPFSSIEILDKRFPLASVTVTIEVVVTLEVALLAVVVVVVLLSLFELSERGLSELSLSEELSTFDEAEDFLLSVLSSFT